MSAAALTIEAMTAHMRTIQQEAIAERALRDLCTLYRAHIKAIDLLKRDRNLSAEGLAALNALEEAWR